MDCLIWSWSLYEASGWISTAANTPSTCARIVSFSKRCIRSPRAVTPRQRTSLDIQRYMDGFPVTARPDSFAYRAGKFVSRHRLAVTAASLFVITVIGLSIGLARPQCERERDT
jgi:hypothetical protein